MLCRFFLRSFKFSFKSTKARVAQLVEQLICNQLVGGSSPFSGSGGQVPERPNGADCKSAVFRLQWFESTPAHMKPF